MLQSPECTHLATLPFCIRENIRHTIGYQQQMKMALYLLDMPQIQDKLFSLRPLQACSVDYAHSIPSEEYAHNQTHQYKVPRH